MTNTSLANLREELAREEQAAEADVPREPGRFAALLVLLALIAFHVAANLWWFQADNHPIRTDEEGHMQFARTYHEVLFVNEYPDPVRRLIAASHIRPGNPAHPPLFHVLGACMIAVFGYSTDVIAASNTVLFVLLLFGCYAIARTFLRPWQSLFVAFVVSFTPMIFAASRFFVSDYASATIVVWGIYALLRSEGFRHPGWVFLFAVLNGLGILARTITFAYLLFPAAAAVLFGLFRIVRNRPNDFGKGTLGGLAVNCAMALTVTIGIFGPWYYANLEPFYEFWANKQVGDSRGPLTNFAPPPDTASPATAGEDTGSPGVRDSAAPEPAYQAFYRNVQEKFTDPPVAWVRYPIYVLNNGLFVPLAACALLGMLLALCRPPFWSRTLVHLFIWILGSWLFFSVMIRFGTPRYALPVAPALAFFAALFVLALPGRWVRLGAGGLLAAVLLFQYGNLTFGSYGAMARQELPVSLPPREAHHFVDDHPVVYKDYLTLSDSYARLGPPVKDNFKERLVRAMLEHERTLPVREGQYARYQKLNLRGLELHQRHYWPGDNPYRLASLPPEEAPERKLRMIHMGKAPEHLLPRLGETDYIVYQADTGEREEAERYVAFFEARGFEAIESFEVPAYGWVPARIYGVLARKLEGELVPVNAESIAEMDLYDLHDLKYSADFQLLSPALRDQARNTFESKLAEVATPFQMNEAVTFMTADVSRAGPDTYRFRLVFQVHKALDRDWRMLFHGFVEEENLDRLPPEKQEQGYIDWNFNPLPPCTDWVPEDYVVLVHQIQAPPLVFQFKFGFFQEDTLYGRTALLKTMDLGAIP